MRNKILGGLFAVALVVLGLATPAFAVDPTPSEAVTSVLTPGVSAMIPALVAIATGTIGLAVLWFAVKKAHRAVRSGGRV
jgi:hypothetical protein